MTDSIRPTLHILGLGIHSVDQLTLEALSVLKISEQILVLPIASEVTLSRIDTMQLGKTVDLKPLYREGDIDENNYKRILEYVLEQCCKSKNISLLVPGHPRIGVTLVQWLTKNSEKTFRLKVYPGVSSFDTMINDLEIDPIERGSSLLDANRVLLFDQTLDQSMNHFIYHVCSIGTSRVFPSEAAKYNRIDLLKNHLLKFYREDHEVYLISSNVEGSNSETKKSASLSDLENFLPHINFGTTLFIPATKPKRINKEYLKLLQE